MSRNTNVFRKTAKKRMNRPERMDDVNNGFLKAQNFFFSASLNQK